MIQEFNYRRIQKLLQKAKEAPYYKKVIENNCINIENINTYDDFCKFPITLKSNYKNNALEFITNLNNFNIDKEYINNLNKDYIKLDEYFGKKGLGLVITSGSTGIPIEVVHSHKDDIRNYICLNAYRKKIGKFDLLSKYVWILPMNPKTQSFFYKNNQRYIRDEDKGIHYFLINFSENSLSEFHKVIVSDNIKWMCGSPTSIVEYCNYLNRHNIKIQMDYVELHSEPCLSWQTQIIKNTLDVSPVSVYSSNEINFIAATCSKGCLHILEENVFVELVDKGYGDENVKKILLTGLNYFDTPLIRYDIGDLGMEADCHDCELKSHPAIKLMGYRDSDMIINSKNELIEPYVIYDAIFFLEQQQALEIGYYQVTQVKYDIYKFEFADLKKWNSELKELVKRYLESFISEGIGEQVNVILREYSLNNLESDERRAKYKRVQVVLNSEMEDLND